MKFHFLSWPITLLVFSFGRQRSSSSHKFSFRGLRAQQTKLLDIAHVGVDAALLADELENIVLLLHSSTHLADLNVSWAIFSSMANAITVRATLFRESFELVAEHLSAFSLGFY